MQTLRNLWPARHPDNADQPNTDYTQARKMKDEPPYNDIYMTNHGIEALRTQSEKFAAMKNRGRNSHRTDYNTGKSYGNRVSPGRNQAVRTGYGREYSRENSYNGYGEGEDINIEAEEFIEEEHKRLNLMKWMSTSSFSYYQNQESD
ncbi:OLC1v1028433C1 [Oldenlandia corymbosa var. corymbosa]|uniref:OLC1v1028433C1 n=1 Tax=Oldenlandia corymbosa var. corymbosa TaxID=529605 RepID=A0AAV1CER4_OLDCO|nr:OLC1v1028433C1 [Oldenlandia corymbosa var. corymbosa]